ncbi:hypothetical protein ScPMuIL_013010 [Solemya velum]
MFLPVISTTDVNVTDKRYTMSYPTHSHGNGSDSEGSAYEMKPWPSYYSSQTSMMTTGSYRSMYSTYTPSQASYILPVVTDAPDAQKRPPDHWGFAFCSLFCNPVIGILAIILSEMSKNYFNRCNYSKAAKYGSYAKGMAVGGIIVSMVVLVLIITQGVRYQLKLNGVLE